MSPQTDATRNAALSILEAHGMSWVRVGRGQRFVVHIEGAGRKKVRALVKAASLGSAMVRTDRDDADSAKLLGFEADVDHVLFAVGSRDSTEIVAYLVPIKEVEAAYRSGHRVWRSTHAVRNENTTWVLWFNDSGTTPECNGFDRKWAQYRVGTSSPTAHVSGDPSAVGHGGNNSAIEDAKGLIAARLGVSPDQVKIVIEY